MTPKSNKPYTIADFLREMEEINVATAQQRIKNNFETIDGLRKAQSRTMHDVQISVLVRGWISNRIEEEIEALKAEIKMLTEKY